MSLSGTIDTQNRTRVLPDRGPFHEQYCCNLGVKLSLKLLKSLPRGIGRFPVLDGFEGALHLLETAFPQQALQLFTSPPHHIHAVHLRPFGKARSGPRLSCDLPRVGCLRVALEGKNALDKMTMAMMTITVGACVSGISIPIIWDYRVLTAHRSGLGLQFHNYFRASDLIQLEVGVGC